MRQAWQWVMSVVFIVQMYVAMVVIGLAYLPAAIRSPQGAIDGCHAYCRWVRLTARVLCNLRTEVRGTPPEDAALIAAKHQSFLDIIL
ncbi:hypothetical protein, partial [Aphanothece microscopica]|uniref:hypothetical protein n=1 Tax=Aphanothece microscopica TaxID=1049561 RepID=UPI003984FB28